MKVSVMLYLDGDLIRDLNKRKVNKSELVNSILRFLSEATTESAEEITLAILRKDLQDNQKRLISLDESYVKRKRLVETNIGIAKEKIEAQKEKIKEIRRSIEIASIIRELNDHIITENYDYSHLKDDPLLMKLREFDIPVDEKWLRRQIQRIKLLGRF